MDEHALVRRLRRDMPAPFDPAARDAAIDTAVREFERLAAVHAAGPTNPARDDHVGAARWLPRIWRKAMSGSRLADFSLNPRHAVAAVIAATVITATVYVTNRPTVLPPLHKLEQAFRPSRESPNVLGRRAATPAPLVEEQSWQAVLVDRHTSESPQVERILPPEPAVEIRDRFAHFATGKLRAVAEAPVSTFSIDVDTASYAFVRETLERGALPPKDAVRVEEMINYFDYAYARPEDRNEPFRPSVEIMPTPWNPATKLLRLGIKGFGLAADNRPRANLVFLIDTSGSMAGPDRLPLLVAGLRQMVGALRPDDTVAIVTYAGTAGVALAPTAVRDRGRIVAVLDGLSAGGSTAGAEGLRQAYALARLHRDGDGISRVVLATDGDLNVGITDPNELQAFIERERDSGIELSVLGFGQGNYNDLLLQRLAQHGNGQAFFIDSLAEARRVMVERLTGMLAVIAHDVKIRIEFNPAAVAEYRLIGYETRQLERRDFADDGVDAGEVGADQTVTALYELTPAEGAPAETLRYGHQRPDVPLDAELGFLALRYKLPGEATSRLMQRPITWADASVTGSEDARFATAVAAFGQLLRGEQLGSYDYADVLALARGARGADPDGSRAEFVNLVRDAAAVALARQ